LNLDPSSGIGLFTDGSAWAKDRSGGWAWVAIDAFEGEEHDSGYVSDTSSNRMEMQAWIEGLNAVYNALGPCIVLVYCDSQVVGRGYTGVYARKSNVDLWEALQTAADLHEYVEWQWIKGHAESKYNELADKLAGKARRDGTKLQAKRCA
jgi:ribonuclease HI